MSRQKQIILRPNQQPSPKDERDKARITLARKFLWELMAAAKAQVDPVTWIREGGLDAEEFLECVDTGRWHPWLKRWQGLKATVAANRQAPTHRELAGRRMVVLAVIALERLESFRTKDEAYAEVAKETAGVFERAPSGESIQHWRRDLTPPLGPGDELVLAGGITRARGDRQTLITHFVGLARVALVPVALW